MIRNDEELQAIVNRVSQDLSDIQEYLGDQESDAAKIRFPRGYLRAAVVFQQRLEFLRNDTLKRNISYSLILSDVLRWIINRTDLGMVAREMVIKEGICLMAAIAESLTKEISAQEQICGNRNGYEKRCKRLNVAGFISDSTESELKWLWATRQNEHLFLATDREMGRYALADYNRAVLAVQALENELRNKLDSPEETI
jgi:hypothetical protein